MTVRVKICGLTRLDDAMAAAAVGADYLGFVLYPRSKRYLQPESCTSIVSSVRQAYPTVKMVAVTVNETVEQVLSWIEKCGFDYAQLSGDEEPEAVRRLTGLAFKAILPDGEVQAVEQARLYANPDTCPALVLDAHVSGQYGGTGARADAAAAARLAKDHALMIAGGLDPENVADAVRLVRPWAVDVSSGVEAARGVKDHAKMRRFIENAKKLTTGHGVF
jgi:phosphoribosylanthranilate isomerase